MWRLLSTKFALKVNAYVALTLTVDCALEVIIAVKLHAILNLACVGRKVAEGSKIPQAKQ